MMISKAEVSKVLNEFFDHKMIFKGIIQVFPNAIYFPDGVSGRKVLKIYEELKLTNDVNELDENDNVDHPKHYNVGKYEVIDVIEDWKLNFNLGNAVKYVARCEHKDNKIEDIKKAIWYLSRELDNELREMKS